MGRGRPRNSVDQGVVIRFIKEHIIHRFGLPETINTDQATAFVGDQVKAFAQDYDIRLTNSTPYYAQANGLVEAANKTLKNTMRKMMEDKPHEWHLLLSEVLWAYRTSYKESIRTTPYALTYGHDAVLTMEVTVPSLRVAFQEKLLPSEYTEAMIVELENLSAERLRTLDSTEIQKKKMARAYNKKIKFKAFQVGDLVWKVIFLLGTKDPVFRKWSPTWEGPFKIKIVIPGGAYALEELSSGKQVKAINGCYLKKYYPTVWEAVQNHPQ